MMNNERKSGKSRKYRVKNAKKRESRTEKSIPHKTDVAIVLGSIHVPIL